MELVDLPFYREQLRWGLACYRHNRQVSVPQIRTEMVQIFGEQRIDNELSAPDLYNFLEKGTQTRAFKLKLIEEFLRQSAPSYVRCLAKPDLVPTVADFIERFMTPDDADTRVIERHFAQAERLANKTFVCAEHDSPMGGFPTHIRRSQEKKAKWRGFERTSKMKQVRLGMKDQISLISCLSVRLLSNKRHLQFLAFNVDIDPELIRSIPDGDEEAYVHPKQEDVDIYPAWQAQVLLNQRIELGKLSDRLPIRNIYTGVLVPTASENEYLGLGKTIDGTAAFLTVSAKQEMFDDAWWVSVQAIDAHELGRKSLNVANPLEHFMVSERVQRENTEVRFIDELVASADWSMS